MEGDQIKILQDDDAFEGGQKKEKQSKEKRSSSGKSPGTAENGFKRFDLLQVVCLLALPLT